MKQLSEILDKKSFTPDTRNKHEFQAYGNRLAEELNDIRHRALYIKMAKSENRGLIESAKSFVIDQDHITDKGRLFMWKFSQLKKEHADKKKLPTKDK